MKRILIILMTVLAMAGQARAQKTCVIASAEDHVPIREALIHTNNNHWARTDYRGYWTMRYQFDSATVSKPGYIRATIRFKELPDTVFLLPESKQIGEVTIWGKNQEHIEQMEENIKQKILEDPQPITGIGFNAFGWMDRQGKRDQKHLKEAKKIFKEMDRKDPIVDAYEKATGKIAYDLKHSDEQESEPIKKETWSEKIDENQTKMRNPSVKIDTSIGVTK